MRYTKLNCGRLEIRLHFRLLSSLFSLRDGLSFPGYFYLREDKWDASYNMQSKITSFGNPCIRALSLTFVFLVNLLSDVVKSPSISASLVAKSFAVPQFEFCSV